MKSALMIITLAGSLSTVAFAQGKALLTKKNYSGYTTSDGISNESCEVFSTYVTISHTYGGAFTSEKRQIATAGIERLIERAAH